MALKSKINDDLKAALLGGDHFKSDVLRGLKAVILNEEIVRGERENGLDDSSIEKIVSSEIKKRKDSANIYQSAGRDELSEKELSEAEILTTYLPKQLSEKEIKDIISELINSNENIQMGQLIGLTKQRVGNSADGALVAKLVKEALQ